MWEVKFGDVPSSSYMNTHIFLSGLFQKTEINAQMIIVTQIQGRVLRFLWDYYAEEISSRLSVQDSVQ